MIRRGNGQSKGILTSALNVGQCSNEKLEGLMNKNQDPRRGYHDIGGDDYGPVNPDATEMKPWERQSTAISNALGAAGRKIYVTDESRRMREQMGEKLYNALKYYERSTESMKMILVEKGLFTEEELEKRMEDIKERMARVRR